MIISAFADEAGNTREEQADALIRNGLNYIDIRILDGVGIQNISLEDCEEYAKYFASRGIKVNCIGSPVGKSDIALPPSYEEDRLRDMIKKADIFGTDKIRIFSYYKADGQYEEVAKRLTALVAIAKESNKILYLENELNLFAQYAKEVNKLVTEIDGLKCLYDPGNYAYLGQDILEAEELLLDKSEFFHIKDSTNNKLLVPAGDGVGRIKESLAIAKPKYITLEPHLTSFIGLNTLSSDGFLKTKLQFKDRGEAFDYAVKALKNILEEIQ